jgi:hypothetical protein
MVRTVEIGLAVDLRHGVSSSSLALFAQAQEVCSELGGR